MEMTVGERIATWTPTDLVTLHQILRLHNNKAIGRGVKMILEEHDRRNENKIRSWGKHKWGNYKSDTEMPDG